MKPFTPLALVVAAGVADIMLPPAPRICCVRDRLFRLRRSQRMTRPFTAVLAERQCKQSAGNK